MFQTSWSSGNFLTADSILKSIADSVLASIEVDRTILDSPNRSNENQCATKRVNNGSLSFIYCLIEV